MKHLIISEHALEELGVEDLTRWVCICGTELERDGEDQEAALTKHVELLQQINDVTKIMDSMERTVKYYTLHDMPGSWYRHHPGDACLRLHYKEVGILLKYIKELRKKS